MLGRVGVLWGKGGGVNMITVQCTPVSLKLFLLSHLTDIVLSTITIIYTDSGDCLSLSESGGDLGE